MNRIVSNFLRDLDDDGLYLPVIKEHSFEKIQIHNYYARMFATAMKSDWPQRAYVGLYSGAGRARVKGTGEIVETTAMSVARIQDPFTKYIFVDNDPRCTDALGRRLGTVLDRDDFSILLGDVARVAPLVESALPRFDRNSRLLSLCFIDPFSASIPFDVIRRLSRFRMDFLVLLMLGLDARMNFRQYFGDPSSSRIADLVDCPDWRREWRAQQQSERHVVRFLLKKFDEAMVRLDYRPASKEHYRRVLVTGKNVMQYILVLYSRHELGQRFWSDTLKGTSPQLTLL